MDGLRGTNDGEKVTDFGLLKVSLKLVKGQLTTYPPNTNGSNLGVSISHVDSGARYIYIGRLHRPDWKRAYRFQRQYDQRSIVRKNQFFAGFWTYDIFI